MDPFAAAGAGSMEELRRADEHKRQQQRIASLESEVQRLKSSLGEAQNQVKKAEATAASATAAAAVASIASAGTESRSNARGTRQRQPVAAAVPLPAVSSQPAGDASGNARVQELEATLAAIQRDVDARDEQWRASVGELTKRFNERLARAQQQQAPPAGGARAFAGMSNTSPTPATAALAPSPAGAGAGAPAISAALLESLVASVDGLRADMRAVKATVATLSTAAAENGAGIVAMSPAATSGRGGRGGAGTRAQKSLFDRLGPGIEVDPATESAPRNAAESAQTQIAQTKGASEATTATAAAVPARSAGPRFGDKSAPRLPQLTAAAGTSSEAAAPAKRRGRPPKNAAAAPAAPSAVDAASEAEARRRKELVAEAVRNADRGSAVGTGTTVAAAARGSNEDLIGAYLAQRSQPNLTMRHTDDLRRKYTALASGIADARGTNAAAVLADKFYDMIVASAAAWRDKARTDTARAAMLHTLEPLAFRSAFRDVAIARVVEGIRWAAESAGGGAQDGDRVAPATSDPIVAHEVAACGAGWLVQESDANAHGAFWFDVALAGLRTLRRVRDPAAKRSACACLVAALRGLCRGSALVAGINSHRATLVGIAIQSHVTAVVCPLLAPPGEEESSTAAAREWWLELCALLDWSPQPSASAMPLLEERVRTVAARNRTLNQQSMDAVLAMRIVAQGVSAGVELLYALARDAVNNVSPPMVLLIASLCLDFELAFTDSDRVIAAYLVSSFKGHSFADVDTPAQIVAAVAVLTCSPVPPKSTAAFASEIVAAAGHVRHLARKQHTTPSIRPIVSTAVGRGIIAKVDRFIQLPTSV